ncbi:MAG: hypothetical protein F6K58_13410 [Symploca sp. SIO2E9]|nr:hypothetical protein [Symploca sp. SIO2E9]
MWEKKSGGTSKQTLQTLQTRRIEIPTKISLTPPTPYPKTYSASPKYWLLEFG